MKETLTTLHPVLGKKTFPDKPYIDTLIEVLLSNRFVIIAKSRQMFATWAALSFLLWKAIFEGPGQYLVFSKNERSAKELLSRLHFLMQNIENFELPEIGRQTTEEISFRYIDSRITSLPATPDAPRMYSPKGVLWDEMAFTPYADEIWAALKPAIDSGGAFWGISTSAGPSGLFCKMVRNPLDYGFFLHWLHYSSDVEKDISWKMQCKRGYSEATWRREYEITFEQAANAVYYGFNLQRNTIDLDFKKENFNALFRSIDFGFVTPVCLYIGISNNDSVFVFGEIVGDRMTLNQFIEEIKCKDKSFGLEEEDFEFTSCDPAGGSPGETGISPIERFNAEGFKMKWCTSRIADGVDLIRGWLEEDREATILLNTRCSRICNDIQGYELDSSGELPIKDGFCDHTMDALRYFFINRYGIRKPKFQQIVKVRN